MNAVKCTLRVIGVNTGMTMIYWALAKKWDNEQRKYDYRVEIGVTEEALMILGNKNGWVTGLPDYTDVSDLAEYQAHWIFDDMYSTWVEEEGMTEREAWIKACEICGIWE
tara:strand:- start:261 stop:590 length:330 start_codon:yes stop_codon:yes gene_type:complete